MILLSLKSLPWVEGELTRYCSEWKVGTLKFAEGTDWKTVLLFCSLNVENVQVPMGFTIGNLSRCCVLISENLQL